MPPIRFGIKNIVLKAFVPLIPLVSSIARQNAKTLTVITDTAVNFTVNQRAFTKSLFEKILA